MESAGFSYHNTPCNGAKAARARVACRWKTPATPWCTPGCQREGNVTGSLGPGQRPVGVPERQIGRSRPGDDIDGSALNQLCPAARRGRLVPARPGRAATGAGTKCAAVRAWVLVERRGATWKRAGMSSAHSDPGGTFSRPPAPGPTPFSPSVARAAGEVEAPQAEGHPHRVKRLWPPAQSPPSIRPGENRTGKCHPARPGFPLSLSKLPPGASQHDHMVGTEGAAAVVAAAGCGFAEAYCPTCSTNRV